MTGAFSRSFSVIVDLIRCIRWILKCVEWHNFLCDFLTVKVSVVCVEPRQLVFILGVITY